MKIFMVFLLMITATTSWSQEDTFEAEDEAILERTLEEESSSNQKYTNLVKSTMDLMSPEEEAPTDEELTVPEISSTEEN